MVLPMALLALGAIGVGVLGSPWLGHPFFHLLGITDVHEGLDVGMLAASAAAAGLGMWLAWTVGVRRRALLPPVLRPVGRRLYQAAAQAYYVDGIYGRLIIRPFLVATDRLARFDQRVIDGAVNGVGWLGWLVGQWKERLDRLVVDRLINGLALAIRRLGGLLRWVQTGLVHQYLLVVVVAVALLALVLHR
jgi:NADH-quinone oxidoreductase subunit L